MDAGPQNENGNGNGVTPEGSHLSELFAAAQNPEVKPVDLVRLILGEMSLAYRELRFTTEHSSLEFKIKPLLAQIQALRAMAETACSVPALIVESDIVNLDGPKFGYIIGKFMDAAQAALRETCKDNPPIGTFAQLLADKMAALEEDCRRNLNNPRVLMEYEEHPSQKRRNGAVVMS
jgi:hypothetical protein